MAAASLSLRTKFLVGSLTIILGIGIAMIFIIRPVLRAQLMQIVQQNGTLIAAHVASHSLSPMLTEQYFDLDMMARDLQRHSGSDIRYLFFLDHHGTVVSHTFSNGFPIELQDANPLGPGQTVSIKHLLLGDEEVIDISAPILASDVGVLHIGYSSTASTQTVNEVIRSATGIILIVLLIGAACAALFDLRIVRPLRDLTRAINAVGQGKMEHTVPVRSDDELGQLARSFNEMVRLRSKAAAEREAVIAQLNDSLARVKQLSGMLPICASCKKVRDDKGYWSQIEAYISIHSEAEFSHGLCPDCIRKLYPQYSDDI